MLTSVARPGAGSFFGLVFAVMLLSAGADPITTDAKISFRAAQLWLQTGSMALQPDEFNDDAVVTSPDGKLYSKYPPVAFFNSVPAAWFVRHFGEAPLALGLLAMAAVPAAWTALLALGLALLLSRLGLDWRVAMSLAALSIAGTPLWLYGRGYYAEISQAALLAWVLLTAHLAHEDERWSWLAGLAVGLALTSKATFLALVPLIALALPMRCWLRYGLGLLPGAAILATYNYVRCDDVFAFGYASARDGSISFGTPLLVGAFGNLLSPGKSVLLYAPLLLLAPLGVRALVGSARKFWLLAWAAPLLVQFIAVCKWWAWHGDSAWGPRLLVPLIPWLVLPALLCWQRGLRARLVLGALAVLGALVQLPAILLSELTYINHVWSITRPAMRGLGVDPDNMADDSVLTHFVPFMSPIAAQTWLLIAKLFGTDTAGPPPWSSNGFDKLQRLPELPPWHLWFDASPVAAGLALLLIATSSLLLLRLRRVTAPCVKAARSPG